MLENMVNKLIKNYVITTAQYNAPVNKEFYKNIKKYCLDNEAQLIVIPTVGKNITEEQIIHPTLAGDTDIQFLNNYKINNTLRIKDFGVRSQQINPLTGLERFAQGDSSYIMPGTKQVLKYVANSYDNIPKAIMTTGAITHANYNLKHRMGRIAKADLEYGFVMVEVENNKYFHFRQVKALKNGTFADRTGLYKLGKHYKDPKAKALIIGDLHPGDTDPVHEKATLEQIKHFGGKIDLYLHDTFNGKSISHHYQHHNIRKHEVFKEQGLNLRKELTDTLKVINKYAKATEGNVYIVASNHDEHLFRYLDEGRFVGDKGNDLMGSMLYTAALQGMNPLQYGLTIVGAVESNIKFIERDTGHKLLGYELGNHGDLGSNGGRGSPRSIENANSKSITGHGHSAFKIRNTYRVGTSTHLRLDYNRGFSNWTQTNGVLYNIGTVELINTIKRKWGLKK